MINEQIQSRMIERGITQTTLCNDLGLTISNFNAFVRGKRTFPYKTVIKVLAYLSLSVAPKGSKYTEVSPENLNLIMKHRVKQLKFRVLDIEKLSGLNKCSITSAITGNRPPSTGNLEKLLKALALDIVEYRVPK